MKTAELVKLLKKHGIKFVRAGANHDEYYSPITGKKFPVWRHSKEVPTGTLHEILKQAGVK